MAGETKQRGELASLFAQYSRYGKNFEKAIDAVSQGSVKKHLFRPSGRAVYSVVGRTGDEFLDLERQFCSCGHFFFRVVNGQDELCYHLLSLKIALEAGLVEEIDFDDEEYNGFIRLLLRDVLRNLEDKEDKGS